MIPNLQIPHWDPPKSDGEALSPFPINEGDFDVFSSDHFRMFEFKVRKCPRARSHDWTECPYAHPFEKARRRDPLMHHYSGTACPEFRKGNCSKGASCEFAHGVFECWLHPSRYRTQLCNDGTSCRRRVCFFAHTTDQLRVLTRGSSESSFNESPIRHAFDSSWSQNASYVSSPTSVLNSSLSGSPPASPGNPRYGAVSLNAVSVREIVSSMRNVQLDEVVSSGLNRGTQMGWNLRAGLLSSGWEEEPVMERVESGRELRAKIYAKLSRENSLGRSDKGFSANVPDIGWVSELVK